MKKGLFRRDGSGKERGEQKLGEILEVEMFRSAFVHRMGPASMPEGICHAMARNSSGTRKSMS